METSAGLAESNRRLSGLSMLLFLVGLLARVAPFANRDGRLLRQFPTEDGYLMLTIARNVALGRGMSTADGTMPTNGTQPLATFLWSLCALLVGGSKVATVAAVLGVELLLATATAYAIYLLARRILHDAESSREKAMLAAAGWYASEVVVSHTMNCLESGLYVCLLSLVLLLVFQPAAVSSPRYSHWAVCGVLLGTAFWARNDVVLFCVALAAVHLFWGLPGAPPRAIHRLTELAVAGSIVVCLASPWLLFNYERFGHIIPVSGQSEAMDASFGANASQVGRGLFGYVTMFLPIPFSMARSPPVIGASAVAVALYVWATWSSVRESGSLAARKAWLLGGASTVAFAAFYGLFFGAPHFMSRYFLALSPLYVVAWGAGLHAGWCWLEQRSAPLVAVGALLLVALALGLNVRTYRHGSEHPHFQVVDWVTTNVPESAWVGAPQSGTLGYFHDRTINLDGKVNPAALEARKRNEVPQYVVDSDIEYVADWEVIAATVRIPLVLFTMAEPPLARAFEVVVDDRARNLGVLRRKAR